MGSPVSFINLGTKGPKCDLWLADQELLSTETKKRANEQCMPLYMKQQVAKLQLRKVSRVSAEPHRARQDVISLANRFDSIYAQTQNAMEGRLVFTKPERRHSVVWGEVKKLTTT